MRQEILGLLRACPGEISGEAIARQFHISRAAVGKHIEALRREGYVIDALPRRGYRFRSAPDRLSAAELAPYLAGQQPLHPWQLHYGERVDSTNAQARRLAEAEAPEYTVVIAEEQTQGRGRLRRPWSSAPAQGLWFSLLLRPPLPPQEAAAVTLMAAVAIAQVLRAAGFAAVIKWPNDVLIQGKKVCGILAEMCSHPDSVEWIALGMGININQETFPEPLTDTAISLNLAGGQPVPRAPLAAQVLTSLDLYYRLLLQEGLAPIREKWRQMATGWGHRARVSTLTGPLWGVPLDMNDQGHLLLRLDSGEIKEITCGDLILEPAAVCKGEEGANDEK